MYRLSLVHTSDNVAKNRDNVAKKGDIVAETGDIVAVFGYIIAGVDGALGYVYPTVLHHAKYYVYRESWTRKHFIRFIVVIVFPPRGWSVL